VAATLRPSAHAASRPGEASIVVKPKWRRQFGKEEWSGALVVLMVVLAVALSGVTEEIHQGELPVEPNR